MSKIYRKNKNQQTWIRDSPVQNCMLLSFLDSDVKNIYRINQANTALNIIELRDYGPVVMKMNDTTHIINDIKLENSALE